MKHLRSFASDNNAAVHPDIMQTLIATNVGHEVGYGNDNITRMAKGAFQQVFGGVKTFFVFAGTPANVLGLRTMASSYNGIICSAVAHMYGSECGASENFIGCKLLPVQTQNGKITVDDHRDGLHKRVAPLNRRVHANGRNLHDVDSPAKINISLQRKLKGNSLEVVIENTLGKPLQAARLVIGVPHEHLYVRLEEKIPNNLPGQFHNISPYSDMELLELAYQVIY